jgi:5-methylthioribose kinase
VITRDQLITHKHPHPHLVPQLVFHEEPRQAVLRLGDMVRHGLVLLQQLLHGLL